MAAPLASRLLLAVSFLFFSTAVLPAAGQTSIDEVHVAPRVAEEAKVAGDPTLDTHTAPLKKAVELVLVPVTITDAMDRIITGLDKANFQVFDGKQRQEIQHFSGEDLSSRGLAL